MKNRNIPFGYCYENGTVVIHPAESAVLKGIFDSYLLGQSLLEISKRLNEEKAEYMPGVYGWNKSRLMRLIDDKRYLGNETYPAIVPMKTYETAQRLKEQKNTQKGTDRTADIFHLTVPVICPNCGNKMHRRHDSRWKVPQRWVCHNGGCRTIIRIPDSDLLQGVTDVLNTVIGRLERIMMPSLRNEPASEVRTLDTDISHTLETYGFSKEDLRKKMLECVSLKYKGIDSALYIAHRLKADLEQSGPLSAFSTDLCSRTVKAIQLKTDGTVGLILINDQPIGKEQPS